jgi:ubiquinone biosynthesis protein
VEALTVYNLPDLVKELRRLMLQELDFEREARNMRVAKANFADDPTIYMPKVHTEHTTNRILVMELITGTKLRDMQALSAESRKKLALNGLRASMKQILQDGFFHADPHPGNIFILPDGRLSLLDWGMIGRLTPMTQMKLISLLHGVVEKDSEAILDVFLSLSQQRVVTEQNALHRDIMDILDDYYSVPLNEINMGQLLSAMTNLFQNYRIVLQSDLAIMVKALITSEGSARLLYPELNVIAEAKPFVAQVVKDKYSPWNLQRHLRKGVSAVFKMQKDMPKQLNTILGKLENDELSIGFEHKRLEGMRRTLENTANRVTLGVITASMIIGSSMIITTGVKPLLFGYPALGLVGYLLSGFVGAWLVFDILRKRKM